MLRSLPCWYGSRCRLISSSTQSPPSFFRRYQGRRHDHQHFCRNHSQPFSSQSGIKTQASSSRLGLWEYPSSDGSDFKRRGILYHRSDTQTGVVWEIIRNQPHQSRNTHSSFFSQKKSVYINHDILGHFLPAKFPESVAPGYLRFAGFCFTASVAGSAGMVLSTQTLLLAVGVVGSNTQHAGIMAGAFNWVMKDFVGQLGGVVFASQMGKTKAFDADPKRWRMVAAMALDAASLLEILSPLFPSLLILPVASIANVGKNIGFLTASASRAALHHSVAISANLGDVTAKSGSQSIMAGLIGTSMGIGLSSLLAHDTYNFAIGFCFLGIIHQSCNYLSVQSVRLVYFNRQRLHILLDRYIEDGIVLSPEEVAVQESFFPLVSADASTKGWLSVGSTSLEILCPTPADLQELLIEDSDDSKDSGDCSYLVKVTPDNHVHLMFFCDSSGEDMIRGMYHACLIRHAQLETSGPGMSAQEQYTKQDFQILLQKIREQGWKTDTAVTSIESPHARRLMWTSWENEPGIGCRDQVS